MSHAVGARSAGRDHGSGRAAELAAEHPSLVQLARAGWVAKGLVYALLGVLALTLVIQLEPVEDSGMGEGSGEVSQSGAVAQLAETPLGTAGLWVVAAGLALYVVWCLVTVVLPAESSAKVWATRAVYLVSAAVYAGLALTAVTMARSGGSSSGSSSGEGSRVERITRDLMEMTGGRWLVGLVGAGVIALGAYFLVRAVTASFADDLEPGGVGPVDHDTIVQLGRIGWAGRALMMGIVGWFLVQAAWQYSPDEAQGLDGALREAASSTVGSWLVGAVAFGLIVYGVFCAVSAPRTRLRGAD